MQELKQGPFAACRVKDNNNCTTLLLRVAPLTFCMLQILKTLLSLFEFDVILYGTVLHFIRGLMLEYDDALMFLRNMTNI